MATNNKRIKLYTRKFTSISALDTYFYGALDTDIKNVLTHVYPSGGVFSGGIISSDAADTINVSATDAIDVSGKLISITVQADIPFENLNGGIIYHVGLKSIEVEATDPVNEAVEINSQTSSPEYVYWQEQIGELGHPTAVYRATPHPITIVVDNVVGTNNASGRTVRVWMTSLLSTSSGWYEDLVVCYGTGLWSGSKNYVETVGDFHQTDIRGVISTTVSHYRIWMQGVTITTTDISSDTDYVYLGTVTGEGAGVQPTVFDQTSKETIFNYGDTINNLYQLAYDTNGTAYTFNNDGDRSSRSVGTVTDGDTSPDLSAYDTWFTGNTGSTTIIELEEGVVGDIRTIIARDNNTIIEHNYYLALQNETNFNMVEFDNITLKCVSSLHNQWEEVYRCETNWVGTTSSTSSTSTTSTSTSSSSTSSSTSSTSSSTSSSSTLSTTSSSSTSMSSSSSSSSTSSTFSSTSSFSTSSSSTSTSSSSSSTSSTFSSSTSTSTSSSSSSSTSSSSSSSSTSSTFSSTSSSSTSSSSTSTSTSSSTLSSTSSTSSSTSTSSTSSSTSTSTSTNSSSSTSSSSTSSTSSSISSTSSTSSTFSSTSSSSSSTFSSSTSSSSSSSSSTNTSTSSTSSSSSTFSSTSSSTSTSSFSSTSSSSSTFSSTSSASTSTSSISTSSSTSSSSSSTSTSVSSTSSTSTTTSTP